MGLTRDKRSDRWEGRGRLPFRVRALFFLPLPQFRLWRMFGVEGWRIFFSRRPDGASPRGLVGLFVVPSHAASTILLCCCFRGPLPHEQPEPALLPSIEMLALLSPTKWTKL